nr:peptidoglycan editing factor PgeF [Pseudacidobacterium ailaaui]
MLQVVTCPQWVDLPWLLHGFSTRVGGTTTVYGPKRKAGEMNLGFTAEDDRKNVLANREKFLHALSKGKAPTPSLVTLKQIHSSVVHVVDRSHTAEDPRLQGDGMMTSERGIVLGIQTADCIPVLVIDQNRRAVAAFHAGWRGTLKRIVEVGIGRMRAEFGSEPEDLSAAIGPGIRQCCYAVGEEVREQFFSQFVYADQLFREVSTTDPVKDKYPLLFLTARPPGHGHSSQVLYLDLIEANRRQLMDAGVREDAIFVQGDCTCCQRDRYFSYRAEHGQTGRMLSAVGLRG